MVSLLMELIQLILQLKKLRKHSDDMLLVHFANQTDCHEFDSVFAEHS
jgi:hypothetical protein